MPRNQFQRMVFAFITVVITVHAFVFYNIYVLNGDMLRSFNYTSSVLTAVNKQGGIHNSWFIDRYVKEKTKPAYLKHKDGFRFKIDCIIENNGKTLVCVFPHSFDEKITKEQLEHYINVSSSYGSLCSEVSLVVFSVNRFSDWCVHQASVLDQLFCVTLERLKY